ncbi:MAG: hypothetical protein AAGA99_00735 [Actinomycetota bacterium]
MEYTDLHPWGVPDHLVIDELRDRIADFEAERDAALAKLAEVRAWFKRSETVPLGGTFISEELGAWFDDFERILDGADTSTVDLEADVEDAKWGAAYEAVIDEQGKRITRLVDHLEHVARGMVDSRGARQIARQLVAEFRPEVKL